jgi:predicted metalloprotease
MQWKGKRESSRVDDARDQTSGGGAGAGGAGLGLLGVIGRRFGIKGILAALVVVFVLLKLGIVDLNTLVGGPAVGPTPQAQVSPEDEERFRLIKVVLAGTEDVWTAEFARIGRDYELPAMQVYRGRTSTGCGTGSAEMGPFYCPADRTVYIDLSFYDELAQTFQSPGDFAQAYVIAHEVGQTRWFKKGLVSGRIEDGDTFSMPYHEL